MLTPEGRADWLLSRQARSWGFGSERAYDLLPVAATLLQLGDGCTWQLPAQNRELVEGCTHHSALSALARELGADKWRPVLNEMNGRELAEGSLAMTAEMPWDKELKEIQIGGGKSLETLKTRLGVMDVCVTCLTPLPSPLGGEPLSSFSLPAWMFGDGLAELESLPQNDNGTFTIRPRQEGGRICFDFGGQTFYYDATGLISEHELESGNKTP